MRKSGDRIVNPRQILLAFWAMTALITPALAENLLSVGGDGDGAATVADIIVPVPVDRSGEFSLVVEGKTVASRSARLADERSGVVQYDVVSHTHADLTWPDSQQVCLDALVQSIVKTLEILETHPDFRFSMETVYPLEQFLARYPEKAGEIRSLMERGIFDCGALYTGPWEVVCGQEGLIRQLYYGKKWLLDNLEIDVKTAWNPDLPGHTLQMPQILAKAGVDGFITERNFSGPTVHWWQSPDGSRVLRVDCYISYGASRSLGLRKSLERTIASSDEFADGYRRFAEQTGVPLDLPLLVADGVDIQLPSAVVAEVVGEWNRRGHSPPMKMKTGSEYIHQAAGFQLPTLHRDQPSMWDDVRAVGEECIRELRSAGSELVAAEVFSTIAGWLDPSFAYPQSLLDRSWRNFLIVTEHNWGGGNGAISDQIKTQQAIASCRLAAGARQVATTKIARLIDHEREGIPIAVFNALSWRRHDIAEAKILFTDGEHRDLRLVDGEGQEVPMQVTRAERRSDGSLIWAEIAFEADVPSVGYKTYYLEEGNTGLASPFKATDHLYENDFYRIEIDGRSGSLSQLFSKKAGHHLADDGKFRFGEIVMVEDSGVEVDYTPTGVVRYGREWKPDSIRAIENGPARLVVRVEGPLLNSRWRVDYILYRSLDKIDVRTMIDWNGDTNWNILQCFPVRLAGEGELTYEIPFTSLRVGEETPFLEEDPVYQGVHNWLDHSDNRRGLTLATGVGAVSLRDQVPKASENLLMQAVLLRTVRSCHSQGPVYEQKGRHYYRFALHAHGAALEREIAVRQGWELNSPLLVVVGERAPGGTLPLERSFLSIDPPNALLSTLKRAEHPEEGWILRCWESTGRETEARVTLSIPAESVEKVDIIEEGPGTGVAGLRADGFSIRLGPAAIETYRLKM